MTITRLMTPFGSNGVQYRPNRMMTPTSVTIHNTANKNANAYQHARAQAAGNLAASEVAVHYYVDDESIYQCIEDNWQGWHAGDGGNPNGGNYTSIAIEVCEQRGIDQRRAFENAARLAAELAKTHGFGIEGVKTHQYWSGKYCPHILLDGTDGMDWNWFLGLVEDNLKASETVAPPPPDTNTPSDWAREAVGLAVDKRILLGDEKGSLDLRGPVTMERLLVILHRCGLF